MSRRGTGSAAHLGVATPTLEVVHPPTAPPVTAVVVAPGGGPELAHCLDALACQRDVAELSVIVVDRPSSTAAETARSHPAVDRVVLGADDVPGALVGRALWSVRAGIAIVMSPSCRPGPGWLRQALDGFETGADGVWAPVGGSGAFLVDLDALWRAWWRDGIPRIPPGDSAQDVRRWFGAAGLWSIDVSRVPPARLTPPRAPAAEVAAVAAGPIPFTGLVSVVVCSHGRPDDLARCLASLQNLPGDDDHEVLVVDNGEQPQYDTAAIEAAGGRHLHEPRRGLDHARNRGYREAAGEVVAYLDDDCEVDTGWLDGIRRGMADPSVGIVTGRVVPASLARPSERWFEAWFGFDRGTLPDRCAIDDTRPWAALYPSVLGTGANMAFRREVLEQIGGFDELLDVGSTIGGGGDIDAFARALDAGAVGVYEPAALVVHHHRRTMRALRKQFFGYGQALGALCAKYALDRPGHKREAVRFYRDRMRDQRRRARLGRRRTSALPRSLTLIEIAGQLHGPVAYLWARRPRRP